MEFSFCTVRSQGKLLALHDGGYSTLLGTVLRMHPRTDVTDMQFSVRLSCTLHHEMSILLISAVPENEFCSKC